MDHDNGKQSTKRSKILTDTNRSPVNIIRFLGGKCFLFDSRVAGYSRDNRLLFTETHIVLAKKSSYTTGMGDTYHFSWGKWTHYIVDFSRIPIFEIAV